MNFQSKTFAGTYKVAAFLAFLSSLSGLVAFYLRPEVLVESLALPFSFGVVISGAMAFQAIIYPTPEVVADSDND